MPTSPRGSGHTVFDDLSTMSDDGMQGAHKADCLKNVLTVVVGVNLDLARLVRKTQGRRRCWGDKD